MHAIIDKIASREHLELLTAQRLSGGDINAVFLLKCRLGDFVVKVNLEAQFPGMFAAEAKGLELLAQTQTIAIPKVINHGPVGDEAYLLLEYITPGSPAKDFREVFGQQLAALHKHSEPKFGLDHSNYIGSLEQHNNWREDAAQFYISERLEPQFQMAGQRGFRFSNLDRFYKNISEEIPKDAPALIHGDLWSGNYLVSATGQPVLIDPSVAFAPREMDLAMMQLFGGFPSEVFSEYHNSFPLTENWNDRVSLWQLYYLLVHLNLFGRGYLSRVQNILKAYS